MDDYTGMAMFEKRFILFGKRVVKPYKKRRWIKRDRFDPPFLMINGHRMLRGWVEMDMKASSNITKGQPVYVDGSNDTVFQASGIDGSSIIGYAKHDIEDGGIGGVVLVPGGF